MAGIVPALLLALPLLLGPADAPRAQGLRSPLTPAPAPLAPTPATPLPDEPPAAVPAGPPPGAPTAAMPRPAGRPRIGLALSGGGARGFAHVGVLRALEAMRIPVDCIAGTSAGSAVGAAYATGHAPDAIEASLRSVDWDRDMFDDAPPRRDQQPRRRTEEKAYLLDLTFGYRDGSVLLPPGLLVDGGLTRNMPVDVVRAMCADVVIAVDIGGPLLKREELGSVFGVAGQMIGILMERNMRESRAQVRPGVDVMIRPELGDIGSGRFSRGVCRIPPPGAAARPGRGAP
ncbi:MAG TPA: patatin-like phospholipase family protein, partial [Burkholderiaceae bacterium]|nr:patatin-like phospholipase family protein [Burkholderiaceae bacterium]